MEPLHWLLIQQCHLMLAFTKVIHSHAQLWLNEWLFRLKIKGYKAKLNLPLFLKLSQETHLVKPQQLFVLFLEIYQPHLNLLLLKRWRIRIFWFRGKLLLPSTILRLPATKFKWVILVSKIFCMTFNYSSVFHEINYAVRGSYQIKFSYN